jgi:hypothetical protein
VDSAGPGKLDRRAPSGSQPAFGEGIVAMVPALEYIHTIKGRLRIKVRELKRSPAQARQVEALFQSVEGIQEVRANPITGNVLFLHDPERIAAREILALLIAAGYLRMRGDEEPARADTAGAFAVTFAKLVCWLLVRAWQGFNLRQSLIERLIEAVARFLIQLALGRLATALA